MFFSDAEFYAFFPKLSKFYDFNNLRNFVKFTAGNIIS